MSRRRDERAREQAKNLLLRAQGPAVCQDSLRAARAAKSTKFLQGRSRTASREQLCNIVSVLGLPNDNTVISVSVGPGPK